LLVIVLVIIIAASAFTVYLTSPSWLPRATALSISPSSYSMAPGQQLALASSVKYGSATVSGGTITWKSTGGTLNQYTGTTVVFTAPSVTSNQTFTISASFGGTGVYQPSSSTAQVTVSPPTAAKTTVTVTPPTFEVYSGDTQLLTASVQSNGETINASVSWALSPAGLGSLSSASGLTVTYTAPTVQQTTPVMVTASFAGNAQYKPSSADSNGSILPTPAVKKATTTMVVSPSSFSVESGQTQNLTATVEVNGTALAGAAITWTLAPSDDGSLSGTTGSSVTYTAPTVQQNTSVTITAAYAGDSTHLPTSGDSTGVVTPPSMAEFQYTLKFSAATMTTLSLHGPIILNGTSVTMITADSANLTNMSLTRFGLTAPTMVVDDLVLYTTYVGGYSSALGGTLSLKGGQSTDVGPIGSATFSNVTISLIRMEGASANLTGMVSVGQYVGGSEPYIPSIITAPKVSMSDTYSITGPTTWLSEVNMVSNVTTGRIDLPQFSLQHPISYSLDRQSKAYNATNVWSLTASSATAFKVSAFIVYFKVTGGEMVTIIATGSDNPNNLIPFGLNTGGGFDGLDANVQPVYFSAAQLNLGSFVISITPPSDPMPAMSPAAGLAVSSAPNGVSALFPSEDRSTVQMRLASILDG